MASDSNMYLPCFALPYQRVPCLRCTLVSVSTHTLPAFFVCDVCCFAEPEDARVVGAGVVEGEEVGIDFAELGAVPGVAVAGGLSELLDCRAWASSAERFTASTVTTSVARDSFFALRFIDLLLTEVRAS